MKYRLRTVFQHVSLGTKFTQKHFPNHGGIYIYHLIAYKIMYLRIYFVFKRSFSICHIIQRHFQWVPIDLEIHFQNYKHFLKFFGLYVLTTVNTKTRYQEFLLICLFTKLQRHKKSFVFRNSVVKMQRVLFGNEPFLRKMLESFFGSNIPLYIGKNPVEKLLRFWKWNLKRTPQSA